MKWLEIEENQDIVPFNYQISKLQAFGISCFFGIVPISHSSYFHHKNPNCQRIQLYNNKWCITIDLLLICLLYFLLLLLKNFLMKTPKCINNCCQIESKTVDCFVCALFPLSSLTHGFGNVWISFLSIKSNKWVDWPLVQQKERK